MQWYFTYWCIFVMLYVSHCHFRKHFFINRKLVEDVERIRYVFTYNLLFVIHVCLNMFAECCCSGDLGLLRFLGDNKLPRENPLVSLPLYSVVSSLVAAGLMIEIKELQKQICLISSFSLKSILDCSCNTFWGYFESGGIFQVFRKWPGSRPSFARCLVSWDFPRRYVLYKYGTS